MLSKLLTFFAIISAHLIHALAHLVPRDRSLYVCMGWHHNGERELFADNSKYFFLYLHAQPHMRAVWLARDKAFAQLLTQHGYKAHPETSLRGIYYALRAGTTIVDAHFRRRAWQWSGGSRTVQLWHGKGFKKSGHAHEASTHLQRLIDPQLFESFDHTIATSAYTAPMMAEILDIPRDRILITGLPRNDILFRSIPGAELDAHPDLATFFTQIQPGTRAILYAPTFRRGKSEPLRHLDLARVQNALAEQSAQLVISLHPKNHQTTLDVARYPNITFIGGGYDICPYLAQFDTLITDYGSLFLEFVMLDKHTVFFTYDIDEYKQATGLYEDYDRLTPGPHVTTTDALIAALDTRDAWAAKREEVRSALFAHLDGNASTRLSNALSAHT